MPREENAPRRYYVLQEFTPRGKRKTVATFSGDNLDGAFARATDKSFGAIHSWEIITRPRPGSGSAVVGGTTKRAQKLKAEGALFRPPAGARSGGLWAREENARRTKEQIASDREALVAYVEKHPGVEARDIMHNHPSSEVRMRGEAGIRSDLNALVESGAIEKRVTTRSKDITRGTFAGTGSVTTSVAEYYPVGTAAEIERSLEEMKARVRAKRGPKPKAMPKRKRNSDVDSSLASRLRF